MHELQSAAAAAAAAASPPAALATTKANDEKIKEKTHKSKFEKNKYECLWLLQWVTNCNLEYGVIATTSEGNCNKCVKMSLPQAVDGQ